MARYDDNGRFRETEAYLALLDAEEAFNMFLRRAQRLADAGADPTGDDRLRELKRQLHTHVMYAFRTQRPYIKRQLENSYWATTDLDGLTRTNGDGEEEEGGLKLLDDLILPVSVETVTEAVRHKGQVTKRVSRMDLPGWRFYKAALDALSETAELLGLVPEADARKEIPSDPNPI